MLLCRFMNKLIIKLIIWHVCNLENFNEFYKLLLPLNKSTYQILSKYDNPIIYDHRRIKKYIHNATSIRKITNVKGNIKNIPNFITYINLSNGVNKLLTKLPTNLQYLKLGIEFNKSIDDLPDSVTHIFFPNNGKFNKVINKLPTNLIHLELNDNYNLQINNIPNNVECISVNSYYNHTNFSFTKRKLPIVNQIQNTYYDNNEFIIDYIYLDDQERKQFISQSHVYI